MSHWHTSSSSVSPKASRPESRPGRWPGRTSATWTPKSNGSPWPAWRHGREPAEMDFALSSRAQDACERMWAFMDEEVFAAESVWDASLREHGEHSHPPIMEELKASARRRG